MVARLIKNQINTTDGRSKIFWVFCAILVLFVISYGYLVNASIFNGIAREGLESEISELSSEVNELEFTYLKAKNSITLERAYDMGFVDAKNKIFVERKPLSNGLSLNLNEI